MRRERRDGRGGYILVAVLAVVVVLTGLLAAGSLLVRSALGTARVEDADVAAAGLASSGLEIAAYQLAVLKIDPDLVDGRRIRLTGGTVTPHVIDEAGKVDLNAADPKLIAAALESVGLGQTAAAAIAARVVELRGPVNGAIAGDGATQPQGANNAPPKRRGLQSVEDLADFEGVTRDDMRLLRRRLTIYNPDGRLDIRTAAPDLLASIPGMSKVRLTLLLAARESGSADALNAVQGTLGDIASFIKASPGPAYTVRVDVEEKGGRKKSAQAVIAASKSPNQPYYVLDWRE